MKKQRLVIVTFLVAMLSACCALFAVACNKAEKFTITWDVDSHATVQLEGYDTLPATVELEKDTEITFKVTPAAHYEIKSVSAGKKQDDGVTYKYTVTKNDTIKVTTQEKLESVTVTTNPSTLTYYAGQTLDDKGMVVTAKYETGTETAITNYTVNYANGKAFAIGDTSFTVSFGGKTSAAVNLNESVVGLVTLKLNGGSFSADELAKLPAGYVLNEADGGTVTWTFTEAFAADYVLPLPTIAFPGKIIDLDRWSGVEGGKIAKDTVVSVTASAVYKPELVEIEKMEFTSKEGVPYLVISGMLNGGDSAYLVLCEGNKNIKYDKNVSAEKKADNSFVLELNLAEVAVATPVKLDPEKDTDITGETFIGPWLDIRFFVVDGTNEYQQELFVSDDITYANLDDAVVSVIGEQNYKFSYQTWQPKAGDPITGGNGAVFTGTENFIKLYIEKVDADYKIYEIINSITLEKKTVEEVESAYLVIEGKHFYDTEDEAKTAFTGYIFDMQNFDGWAYVDITDKQSVTVTASTFRIELCLDGISAPGHYVMHKGDASTNYNPKTFDKKVKVSVGYYTYSLLSLNTGWGWNWTCINVEDNRYEHDKSVILDNGKPYFILNGDAGEQTADDIKAKLTQFDFENSADSSDKTVISPDKITVTIANGVYTVKVDISELNAGRYWVHAVGLLDGKGDIAPDASKPAVTANGKTYKGIDDPRDGWTAHLLSVEEVTPEA